MFIYSLKEIKVMQQRTLLNFNGLEMKDIFKKYLKEKSIFKDKKVLTHSYFPTKILHREKEITQISSILAPALKYYQPSNILIYGTVGTGKTICVKYVLNQLEEVAKENNVNIKTIYINCKLKKVADTEYRLLAQLLNEIGVSVPDTGLPTDVLYRKFFDEIDSKEQVIIIVLDEIDSLVRKVGDEFLYNFTRINSELEKAKISFIGITNNLTFSSNLDARVKSSLGEEEIVFPPYNAVQLKDILAERVKLAFNSGTVPQGVINKCAALAAQEHGDARRALDLLRVAGEIAERNGRSTITEEDVDMADRKIDMDHIIESVKTLPHQSQAVLYSIIKLKEEGYEKILTGDVFDRYIEICRNAGLRALTQRRVSDLINELDMLGIINAKVISKGRYGRTREINLNIGNDILNNIKSILSPLLS